VQAIEQPRRVSFEERVGISTSSLRKHDVGAFLPCNDKSRDQLGRIL
jgi:hypothetical protein